MRKGKLDFWSFWNLFIVTRDVSNLGKTLFDKSGNFAQVRTAWLDQKLIAVLLNTHSFVLFIPTVFPALEY